MATTATIRSRMATIRRRMATNDHPLALSKSRSPVSIPRIARPSLRKRYGLRSVPKKRVGLGASYTCGNPDQCPTPRSFWPPGVARQRADAGERAGLVRAAVVAVEQVGVGREKMEQPGEAAGREVVAAADARALLEVDGIGEVVLRQHLVRDLKRFLEADGAAQAMPADLQEDLVGDVVVRGAEHPGEDLRKGARLRRRFRDDFFVGEKAKQCEARSRHFSFQQASDGCVQSNFVLRAWKVELGQPRSASLRVLPQNLLFSLLAL
jgi:hypothetical protein